MKTYIAKPHEIVPKWYVVDAADQTLGRLAVKIANILRGRHRPTYTPHVDTGDFVVVVNAARIRVTGSKADQMTYSRYSGYPGGLNVVPYRRMLANHPDRIVEHAVRGMVPHNRLGRAMMRKLKIYAGPEHPHAAQKPEPMPL